MPDDARLYDTDFYAWTVDQATRLRACPPHLRPNGLDVENLAEEVESLGRSDRRAVESFLRLIALHLLKIEFHPAISYRSHWATEVDAFRGQLEMLLRDSPSLRGRRGELYARAWRLAVQDARRLLGDDTPLTTRQADAEEAPIYDLDAQLLSEGWYPVALTSPPSPAAGRRRRRG